MNARSGRLGSIVIAIAVLVVTTAAFGQEKARPGGEVASAIELGIAFLKRAQSRDGSWNEPAQPSHRLGMTALAGLALLENGVPRTSREIGKARELIAALARESDQTYDIALAILFLARCQEGRRGESDALIQILGRRLAGGSHEGIWDYNVPRNDDESTGATDNPRRAVRRRNERGGRPIGSGGDNSNTQFALLGLWAAGRHGFDSDAALEAIDNHFRSSQNRDGRWGYHVGTEGSEAMSCAGLMGLAIAAARPSLAERQTARARGAALAADPAFQAALRAVAQDARRAGPGSDIYYLWSLERVCVALGLRGLDGFDWYDHGAGVLVDRQDTDGGWPHDRWGRLPSTCLALLFLRKANLAFEIDRVLRLPAPNGHTAMALSGVQKSQDSLAPNERAASLKSASTADNIGEAASSEGTVIVTGASEKSFPEISVQFEVRRPDGSFVLDAARLDFHVTEEGRDVEVVDFKAPRTTEAIATTVVLVVDRSLSMEEENRIGGLKRAVKSFLEKLPDGSKVAVIAFGSDVVRLAAFTSNRGEIQTAVDALEPAGATRFYDAVAMALDMLNQATGQRRAVLALTDGEDTFSQSATLESVIAAAKALGLPVYTLGLGSEDEIESADLQRLASSTRGQYYPAHSADELRAIYEQIAERIRSSYSLVYQSDRKLPDGTLRPVRIFYRGSKTAGETTVFIPGMVVPAGGWPAFFLVLLAGLTFLLMLPGMLARRRVRV